LPILTVSSLVICPILVTMHARVVCTLNKNENHFIIQISYTILNQCISLCLYSIGHITKAIIGLTYKVSYHAYQGDNSYSENRQSIKNAIVCKDQIFLFSFS